MCWKQIPTDASLNSKGVTLISNTLASTEQKCPPPPSMDYTQITSSKEVNDVYHSPFGKTAKRSKTHSGRWHRPIMFHLGFLNIFRHISSHICDDSSQSHIAFINWLMFAIPLSTCWCISKTSAAAIDCCSCPFLKLLNSSLPGGWQVWCMLFKLYSSAAMRGQGWGLYQITKLGDKEEYGKYEAHIFIHAQM